MQDESGSPYILAKRYNWSLHEKSNLRKDLERLLGKKFSYEELLARFDLEELIGTSCNILVVHIETDERSYANIESILPKKEREGLLSAMRLSLRVIMSGLLTDPNTKHLKSSR